MAGCHHNPCNTFQITQGKGQHGSRTQRLKNVSTDSVRRQAQRRLLCKFRRHPAGIKGNGNAPLLPLILSDIIGKTLGGLPHRIHIHPVCARSQHTPQPAGPEFQFPVKPVCKFCFIPLQSPQFCLCPFIKYRRLQPQPVALCHLLLHLRHMNNLLFFSRNSPTILLQPVSCCFTVVIHRLEHPLFSAFPDLTPSGFPSIRPSFHLAFLPSGLPSIWLSFHPAFPSPFPALFLPYSCSSSSSRFFRISSTRCRTQSALLPGSRGVSNT